MKKILVPTDFSPNALRSVDYAVQLARHSKAAISLVHIAEEVPETVLTGQQAIIYEYSNMANNRAHQQLSLLKESIEATENIEVTTHLYQGSVKNSIQLAAQQLQADLLIMSTMGHSGLKEWIWGSRTAGIISHCPVPVLALPLEYEWAWPKKMLVTIRDVEEAELLAPAFSLAAAFEARIQVALFTDEDQRTAFGFMQDARVLQYLEEKLHRFYPQSHINTVHLSGHRFLDTLQQYVQQENIDILTMLTHPRNLVSGLFNRSLTRHMAYHSKVPLLAIPA